jgi:redox-sensitive bicupin YhaK (pirin superfamily)
MTAPRCHDIPAIEIPEMVDDDGTRVRVICGDFLGKRDPVDGIAAEPQCFYIYVPPHRRKTLLVSGKPIEVPIAWYGPIVMNTKAELQQAVAELKELYQRW